VFLLGVYVVPSPHVDNLAELNRLNVILFAVVLVLMLVVGTWLSVRMARRSSAWLLEGRDPTPDELARTINYPKRQALMEGGLWLIGLVPFTVLNASYSLELGLTCAIEILLGGLTTCVLTYLLCEWLSRPVIAHALARAEAAPAGTSCPGVASRLTLAWIFGASVPLIAVVMVGLTVMWGVSASAQRIGLAVVVVGSVGLLVGLVVIVTAARGLTQPLNSLRGALGRVERGDLSAVVEVDDASEIGRLQYGFNRMVSGLRERDRLLDLFGRQVGEEVAREALERDGVELGGETREAAVLFVDLVGSTAMAMRLEPQQVVAELNAFFAIVVDCVTMHGGWVNKFEGDAALCIFGAPTSHPDAAGAALSSARLLRSRLDSELPDVRAAIGVSAGPVVAGNVGAAERYEYTVIGDPVNEAARLTDLAKTAPDLLLASDAALERARPGERERWRAGEPVRLRGRDRETVVASPA
jgi:adenylate cyclase